MHKVHIDHRDSLIKERMSKIRNKILVISNKGGVGKSTISALLSASLCVKGFKVGILDADIHGPSIAKMTGIEGIIHKSREDETLEPVEKDGLKIVSMGSILQDSNKALIWRGPIKITVIKQLLADFNWGDLDYLIIDLPPGTGDEPLSICQYISEIKGAIIVTTGQKISMLDVSKAFDFLSKLNIKILSIVENMAEFICPHCLKSSKLFYSSDNIYAAYPDVKLVKLKYNPQIMEKLDTGNLFSIVREDPEIVKTMFSLVE